MKVLIACEESQRVCIEFRKKGHEAYSCDMQECSGGHPEWHIVSDVLLVLKGGKFTTQAGNIMHVKKWDMLIAFPPCTYTSNAGATHLFRGGAVNEERFKKGVEGKKFFLKMLNADCEKIAVENPVPSNVFEYLQRTQIIEPYFFGDEYKKITCLWLKGLPPLFHVKEPTLFDDKVTHVEPKYSYVNAGTAYRNKKGMISLTAPPPTPKRVNSTSWMHIC